MQNVPKIITEEKRLSALREYDIMDTPAETTFDEITKIASDICEAPMALVSFVDGRRQWFKSKIGIDASESPKEFGFCSYAVLQDDTLVVRDATLDERFKDNPFVKSNPNIRFYAGAQLVAPDGSKLGTICVIDHEPREWTPEKDHTLKSLAKIVVQQMELRKSVKSLELAKREAIRLVQSQSSFLANMSHEIRTPLNAVIGMTDLLIDSGLSPGQRKFAEIVQTSGASLLALINDILDLSKIESGKMHFENVEFNIAQIVESQVELVAAKAHAKGLTLMTYICPDLPVHVTGDPGRFAQIILNLVSNAIKFTAKGGVMVSVVKNPDASAHTASTCSLRVEVQDSGIGISEAAQQGLFKAFAQADASTARTYGGTGLGLSICKQLVDAMGGSISLESEPGQGSVFSFTIQFDTLVGYSLPKRQFQDLKVLVVDDDPISRHALSMYFKAWDIQHLAIKHGDPLNSGFDLIMMTEGPENEYLEDAPKLKGTPVILMSPNLHVKSTNGFDTLELSATLSMPLKQSALYEAVNRAIEPDAVPVALPPKVRKPLPTLERALSVLVADDVPANQTLTLAQLKGMGCTGHAVGNGREVLEALTLRSYDLVLMDCQMPEMDGYDATRMLRLHADPKIRDMVVIALTADALAGTKAKCLAAGMNDYLSKPIRRDALLEMLKKWTNIEHKISLLAK